MYACRWHAALTCVCASLARSAYCVRRPPAPGRPRTAPQDGWTPLHIAAENGHTEALKALLAAGANKEAADKVRTCTAALPCRDVPACHVYGVCVCGCVALRPGLRRRRLAVLRCGAPLASKGRVYVCV